MSTTGLKSTCEMPRLRKYMLLPYVKGVQHICIFGVLAPRLYMENFFVNQFLFCVEMSEDDVFTVTDAGD